MDPSSAPPSTESHATPRGRLGRRLLAVLFGLFVALVIAETAFRAAGLAEPRITSRALIDTWDATTRYQLYPSNPHGEFEATPEPIPERHRLWRFLTPPEELPLERITDTPWCVRYREPSLGLRGATVLPEPLPGTQRLMMIGDSFVFGDGVAEDKTLPAQLGEELGESYQVINCGRAGANLGGYVEIATEMPPRFSPSRLVVVCIPNDMHVSGELKAQVDGTDDLVIVRPEYVHEDENRPWWTRASQLGAAAHEAWTIHRVARGTLRAYLGAHDPERNPVGVEQARQSFASLRRIGDERGVLVAVVVYPLMYRPGGEYPLGPAHERLVALAREAGLPVLDIAAAFAGIDHDDMRVHDVDHHPNGRAHGIAARRIATWLRDDVPGFLEPDEQGSER